MISALLASATIFVGSSVAQTVKDSVEFEQMKLKTYKQAHAEHTKTKRPVIVWVYEPKFEAWLATKDLGIHCYAREFPGIVVSGVVIGKDYNGTFCRFGECNTEYDHRSAQIKALVTSITTAMNSDSPMQLAPASKAPDPQPFFLFNQYEYCPTGKT